MQHRMTFVDNWNILEQACLASAVRILGDHETNWSTVCNFLKSKFSLIDRPRNWLTPESCEAQYKWLSDKYVKMEISCERPVNQIIQNLKQIGEYESKPVLEQERTYNELKKRLELVASNEVDSEIVMEFYEDSCKRNREREENMRKHGLKNESPNATKSLKPDNKTDGTSPTTTSPLLSSLLNNPPAVQYRPILSTASFIPNKTTQGTSRTSYERTHTPEGSQRGAYSPNVGSQSSSLSDRPNSFSPSTSSTARKLDFQDPSSSVLSHEHLLSSTKESNRDTTWNNEKSDVNNLENISLIPTTEEFDPDILLQVIGNLQNKQALDKVLDELANEKESIIDKDLNTVTIPLDEAFETDSADTKNTVQILTLPSNSKTTTLLDSSLTNTEFERLSSQYPTTENVIIIEDEGSSEQTVEDANVTSIEPAALLNTESVNLDSSVSSVTISGPSESISNAQSDLQPLVEDLDTIVVEDREEKNIHRDETLDVKLDSDNTEVINVNEVITEKEPIGDSESCASIPRMTEVNDTSVTSAVDIVEIPDVEVEQPITKCIEEEIEEVKEVRKESATNEITAVYVASRPIQISNTFNLENIPVSEPDRTENVNTTEPELVENVGVEDVEQENVPKTEVISSENIASASKISKLVPNPSVETDISSPILPPIVEEPTRIPTPIGEKPVDVKLNTYIEVTESYEVEKTYSKNRRQTPRRRRSTASESSETPKSGKSEEPDNTEQEEVSAKKPKPTETPIKDIPTENLDSELIIKSEEIEEPVTLTQESPTKTKNKIVEAKKWKIKPLVSRRSSIRSQNQNSLSPKSEETVASPSTPSSSKMNDSAASKCKKSLVLSQQRLASQKYSSAFLKPISNRTVAGYEDVIYNPVDLHTIKRKIDNKVIKTVTEFEKDVLLMILNAKMFNRVNPQVYNMAVEMQKEAYREIQLTVQTLGEGVPLEVEETVTEKARKRQAVENLKRDQKPSKRSKPVTKDESLPVKRIKLEENESVI